MAARDPQAMIQQLPAMLQPWEAAIADPAKAQEAALQRFLGLYAQTGYGRERGAAGVASMDDYRRAFPVMTYESDEPLIKRVMAGELGSLVVSTPILARYEIGDLILACQPPYYRCIGRTRWWTPLWYGWKELASFNLGRL